MLEQLIQDYGYLAILGITFIEGESIVILAGVAAHLGFLDIQYVILSAIAGSFAGDQLWYYMGRHWGPKILAKRLSWQEPAQKVYRHLDRHQYWLILTFRFYYGVRNVTPFVVGSAQISRLRFFALNLVGAVVWAILFSYGGYLLGETMKMFVDDYHRYAFYLIGGLMTIGVSLWVLTLWRLRRAARAHGLAAPAKPPTDRGP